MTVKKTPFMIAFACLLLGLCIPADATRIKDLTEIQGARGNSLKGIGLVVGLAGTGDKTGAAVRAQERALRRLNIEVGDTGELKSKNVAVVLVTAVIPAFAKEGTRIDVQVSSFYDSKSLEGGILLDTQLLGIDEQVYAVAQGPVSVGGFNADAGGGASVRLNHVTAGRVPMGAFVEREIPSTITDGERIVLLLKRPDFGTANNISRAVEEEMGAGSSRALGAGSINIKIPQGEQINIVDFIARLQEIEVEANVTARVVINERTGTIVIGGDVRIRPSHVAHGGLQITIANTPVAFQPLPFSEGETVVEEITELVVTEEEARLMPIGGTTAAEVAQGLNRLKVTPRDMIAIFQALHSAGVMDADLEIM